jgi:F-box/leucine-rich repeat protein 7
MTTQPLASVNEVVGGEDRTADLLEELLALIFGLLGSGNHKRCSLVCFRGLAVKATSRLRLMLDPRALLL